MIVDTYKSDVTSAQHTFCTIWSPALFFFFFLQCLFQTLISHTKKSICSISFKHVGTLHAAVITTLEAFASHLMRPALEVRSNWGECNPVEKQEFMQVCEKETYNRRKRKRKKKKKKT